MTPVNYVLISKLDTISKYFNLFGYVCRCTFEIYDIQRPQFRTLKKMV